MSHDVLEDAIHALREEASGEGAPAHATRARILASMRAERRRRVSVVGASAALLAAVLASTAWAAATGRLPPPGRWLMFLGAQENTDSIHAPSGSEPTASGITAAARPEKAPAENTPAENAADEKAPTEKAPDEKAPTGKAPDEKAPTGKAPAEKAPAKVPSARPSGAETDEPAAPRTVAAPAVTADRSGSPAARSAADATDVLYQRAHALHFQSHDHAAARSAWEAYLKAAPAGRFAAFAHYNRALCLVRLGRTAEARRALQPFADGAFGGYRRAEAQSLIDALGAAQP
jgi:outer membrane biosynthesis protein TonB